jgi:hypothetical protein
MMYVSLDSPNSNQAIIKTALHPVCQLFFRTHHHPLSTAKLSNAHLQQSTAVIHLHIFSSYRQDVNRIRRSQLRSTDR